MNEVRKNLIDFVRRLKHAAIERCAQASDRDKKTLRGATRSLTNSVESLIRIIDQHDALLARASELSPEAKAELGGMGPFTVGGDVDLFTLLFDTVTMGNLVTREQVKTLTEERTAAAVTANRNKLQSHDKMIRKHADRIAAEHKHWSRWRIAGEIEKGVKEELGAGSRLSQVTIARRLKLMKFVTSSI